MINIAKVWAKAFYKSAAWLKCKAAYIAERILIDGGLCEDCNTNLGYIVHHTIILNPANINDPDVSLNHKLLRYVCKDCHDKYPGHGVGVKKEVNYFFDENGMPQPKTPP